MGIQREISTLSKDLKIPDYNLIGIIKILNKNNLVDIEISQNEQDITATEQDIVTLCIVAGKLIPHQYEKNFSLTFMHIDKVTNMMGISKNELIESMEKLAAVGLQDHYIDDSGNMTVMQFHSGKPIKKQSQRPRKRGKTRRSNRSNKKK